LTSREYRVDWVALMGHSLPPSSALQGSSSLLVASVLQLGVVQIARPKVLCLGTKRVLLKE
jgi:hypothetical protein